MVPSPAGLRFDFEWRITLFTVLLVPIMAGLAVWQLERADEKAALAASWEQRQLQPPATVAELSGWSAADLAYYPVRLSGTVLQDEYFLLDNRIQGGRFGYEVLAVMQLDGDEGAVLVNRGWIAGGLDRRELPEVPGFEAPGFTASGFTASGKDGHLLEGYLYRSKGKALVLGQEEKVNGWPQVIQQVDMALLESRFGMALFPYVLRQEVSEQTMWQQTRQITPQKVSSNELKTGWIIVNILPAKHTAYAVQWFAMALALLILTLISNSNIHECLQYRRGATKSDG